MSDIAHAREGRHATETREGSTKLTEMRLILIDYATMAFVFMSVAFGPALVWTLVWMAAR
jgi:hypothetical protein